MEKKYFLSIDEGTTSVRAIIFDKEFKPLGAAQENLELFYLGTGWVEQDANEIYNRTISVCRTVIKDLSIDPEEIICAGITTQRATWVLWDKETGEPVRKMMTWQDSRAVKLVDELKNDADFFNEFPLLSEGLKAYHMCIGLRHIMDCEPEIKELVENEKVLIGTPDTWLIYKLTGGKVHATCPSNASSTGAFMDKEGKWNEKLMDFLSLPKSMWCDIKSEADDYGMMNKDILGVEIPILGVVADQQSALFAQGCHEENTAKCTNGTGTFITLNVGTEYKEIRQPYGLKTAWVLDGVPTYMVEGHSITAGVCIEWMKNNAKMFDDVNKLNDIVDSVEDSCGVFFVPALSGYGTPFFDYNARASFMGINGNTTNVHMIRSVVESLAYAAAFVFDDMKKHCGADLEEVKISGGVTRSSIMSQYISDLTGAKIEKPISLEASALGAVQFAAIQLGMITPEDVRNSIEIDKHYEPSENKEKVLKDYKDWQRALERSLNWLQP